MDRRKFIAGGGAAGVTMLAMPNVVRAQAAKTLKMVTSWPKGFPGVGTGAERFARTVEATSAGTLKIELYAAGELVPGLEVFDAVSAGSADVYHSVAYYFQGKNGALNFYGAIPFGLTASELFGWIQFGGGRGLWEELYQPFNLMPMTAGTGGFQMGGWYRKEINTLDDFNGLRMRIPGLGGSILGELGVATVNVPAGEIFSSLQAGTIDAAEFISPWTDQAFGFHKVAKYLYAPGFQEPAAPIDLSFNLDTWNALSETHQSIIRTAAAAEDALMVAEHDANNGRALRQLVNEGVQVRTFSDEILVRLGEVAGDVISAIARQDELSGRIYNSYMDFRDQVLLWADTAPRTFLNARSLPFNLRQKI